MKRTTLIAAIAIGLCLSGVSRARAQAPHEMKPTDKIELFLQHLGKVVQVEPKLYQSLLLEYELGQTLTELGLSHPEPLLGDFIQRGLQKLHPELDAAIVHIASGRDVEAHAAFKTLESKRDPFLSATARLEMAEIDLASKRYEDAIKLAKRVIERDRQFLIPDFRACEILAECYRALEKPMLEYLQYAILLTDYRELPAHVETRAKSRIAELGKKTGQPVKVVAGWMDNVEKLIRKFDTGDDPTQSTQGEILVTLDKMIELQEARERNMCPNCGKGG